MPIYLSLTLIDYDGVATSCNNPDDTKDRDGRTQPKEPRVLLYEWKRKNSNKPIRKGWGLPKMPPY